VGAVEIAKDCEEGGVPPSSRFKFKRGSFPLSELIMRRYERASTLLTSNRRLL
jgi:hypothetical protein